MAYNSIHTGDEFNQRLAAIKPGGLKGQILVKQSGTDFDTDWVPLNITLEGMTPLTSAEVPNNSIYVENLNNKLSFKDTAGLVFHIQLEGFVAPTVQWEDGSSVQWEDGTDVEWD